MPRWTPTERLRQAERIRALCPWTKSTGPRTEAGKARSSRNAWKGGVRAEAAVYARMLRSMANVTRTVTKTLFSSLGRKRVNRPRQPLPAAIGVIQPAQATRERGIPSFRAKALGSETGVFSSFCQKRDWDGLPGPLPDFPPMDLGWLKAAPGLPPDPDLEDLPIEELIAKAERLLQIGAQLGLGLV